jgi:O-acetyl-ADP-ribose deacetylase (regulator of RNase III)
MLNKLHRYFKGMQVEKLKSFGKSLGENELRISICDQNKDVATIFAQIFKEEERIEILCGDLLNISADCIVSPANSFGDMGGGLDKAIDDFFSGKAQTYVQRHIQAEYFGELPVGVASVLSMDSKDYPFLIIAPTMRIPGNVGKSINAYLAMRAILVAVIKHNRFSTPKIKHILMSSLCTGVGGMPYEEAGEQMLKATTNILDEIYKTIVHPAIAPYVLGAKWMLSNKP